jgi:O-antigen/teichoic acid export membrane protein
MYGALQHRSGIRRDRRRELEHARPGGAGLGGSRIPRIAALEAGPLQTEVALRHARLGIASSVVLVAPLVVFADDLLRTLFGSEFAAVATPARILLVASAALATTKVLAATLRALGEPLRAGVADAIALGVTGCGLALLLPPYGLTGAAIASLAAYVASSALMVNAVARKLRIRPLSVLVPRDHSAPAAARAVPRSGA